MSNLGRNATALELSEPLPKAMRIIPTIVPKEGVLPHNEGNKFPMQFAALRLKAAERVEYERDCTGHDGV